jgi:hypothetical protein
MPEFQMRGCPALECYLAAFQFWLRECVELFLVDFDFAGFFHGLAQIRQKQPKRFRLYLL